MSGWHYGNYGGGARLQEVQVEIGSGEPEFLTRDLLTASRWAVRMSLLASAGGSGCVGGEAPGGKCNKGKNHETRQNVELVHSVDHKGPSNR